MHMDVNTYMCEHEIGGRTAKISGAKRSVSLGCIYIYICIYLYIYII